jgi:uncharacterized protein with HEPN domain
MPRDPRAWLWDVRDAAESIRSFVNGLDLQSYAESELVHSAVERKFEVIGEALNQLWRADSQMAAKIPRLPQIVAFRNQLIHGYAKVDHATVWAAIHEALPELQGVVQAMLEAAD